MFEKRTLKLTNRLLTVAQMAQHGKAVADIGTDHALVPIYLVAHGLYEKAFACDIKEGPVKRAEANIRKYGMLDKILPVQCDGIDDTVLKDCETFLIAGMGGELISQILDRSGLVRSEKRSLILQPMTKAFSLRRYLSDHHFWICDEKLCREGGRYYTVLSAKYGGKQELSDLECLLGPVILKNKSEMFYDYLINVYKPLKLAADMAQKGSSSNQDPLRESWINELFALLQEGGRI